MRLNACISKIDNFGRHHKKQAETGKNRGGGCMYVTSASHAPSGWRSDRRGHAGPARRTAPRGDNSSMRPDIYTKAVLTVIAIMLTVIACNQYVNPSATASAQSSALGGVQVGSFDSASFSFFDTRSGELWLLTRGGLKDPNGKNLPPNWAFLGQFGKLGGPVTGWERDLKK